MEAGAGELANAVVLERLEYATATREDGDAYAASGEVLLEQRFVRSTLAEQLPEPRGIRYDPHLAAGAEGSAPNRSGVA